MRLVPDFDEPIVLEHGRGQVHYADGRKSRQGRPDFVGGFEAVVSKQPASLTFTVPAGDFPDGDTTTLVIAEYFDGNEEIVLSDAFVVYVPFVKFWENMRTWAQARDVESFRRSSRPKRAVSMPTLTGVRWSIPFRINIWRKLCSAANTPNKAVITEEQYYSVNPYFFFSRV